MLFETPPDFYDGHVHSVDVDEQGNGLTNEGGDTTHAHEVIFGVVQPYQTQDFVSQHPGEMAEPEGQGPPATPGIPQQQAQPPQPQTAPPTGPAPNSPYESVMESISLLCSGRATTTAVTDQLMQNLYRSTR